MNKNRASSWLVGWLVLVGTLSCYGLEYYFPAGSSNEYQIKYGESGARVSCLLTISCVSNTSPASSSGNAGTNLFSRFSLILCYDTFKCDIDYDPSLSGRLTGALDKIGRFSYRVEIDRIGDVLACDIGRALELTAIDEESLSLATGNVLLPIVAGTWRCVLPHLGTVANGTLKMRDQRRWSAINSSKLEAFLASAETGMRVNMNSSRTIEQNEGKRGVVVLWQQGTEKRQTFEYGDDQDIVVDNRLEVRFLPSQGLSESGSMKIKTTILSKNPDGKAQVPFIGEMFFDAVRINRVAPQAPKKIGRE
jgi:hypothetical protein